MQTDPYIPIACGDYDIYEIAIMQKKQLALEWISQRGKAQQEIVIPLELKIIDGAEYLYYERVNKQKQNSAQKIRLDKITSATTC